MLQWIHKLEQNWREHGRISKQEKQYLHMCLFLEHGEIGRGRLSRQKPVGLDSISSAEFVYLYGLTSVSTISATSASALGEKKPAQGLRIANEIKRVYTSCIITQKIRHHYNVT
jgi:hypothetical protein